MTSITFFFDDHQAPLEVKGTLLRDKAGTPGVNATHVYKIHHRGEDYVVKFTNAVDRSTHKLAWDHPATRPHTVEFMDAIDGRRIAWIKHGRRKGAVPWKLMPFVETRGRATPNAAIIYDILSAFTRLNAPGIVVSSRADWIKLPDNILVDVTGRYLVHDFDDGRKVY